MADLDLSMSLFDFLEVVDLPRVHPQEVLQEVEKFLITNGITKFWHMEGITMNAFKRDSFKDAFMIGSSLPSLMVWRVCSLSFAVRLHHTRNQEGERKSARKSDSG